MCSSWILNSRSKRGECLVGGAALPRETINIEAKTSGCSRSHMRQLDLEQSFYFCRPFLLLKTSRPSRQTRRFKCRAILGVPGRILESRSWRTLGWVLGDPWGLLVRTWKVPGGSWRFLQEVLERSRGAPRGFFRALGNAKYTYFQEFVRFSVCLEQVHFFVFFFVPLPSECFWKHFKSNFGSKACLEMVKGGLWGKECAPK